MIHYTEHEFNQILARHRRASQDRLAMALILAALFGAGVGIAVFAFAQWVLT
jgi:hypothetical protein